MEIQSIKFILMVQDMERAIHFYRDVVGLDVTFESPEWSELTHGDAVIALHGGGGGTERPTGLGIQVRDIGVACREVEAGGGRIASPPKERPGEPIILAEVVDTEGNVFSLSEYGA